MAPTAGPGDVPRVELLADADRPGAFVLLVGGIPQSHVDPGDPRHLDFGYMRRLGWLADLAGPPGAPLRVLHLGGGGLTLARYVAATRPGSSQLAVESDPEVAGLVRRRLPLGQPARSRTRAGRIVVRVADARAELEAAPPGRYDLVVADVFAGAQTPAHLTTAEFTAAARRALAPGGMFAVNIGDGPPLQHARARVAAVRSVFSQVCVIAEAAVLRGRRFGNLVVAAGPAGLPAAALAARAAAEPAPVRVLAGAAVDRFTAGCAPVTDDRAAPSPVLPPGLFA